MTTVIIVLVGALGIILGYAARQREELIEARGLGKKQAELTKAQDALKKREERIEFLTLENITLRDTNRAHETTLQMVLNEMGGSE